MATRGRGYLWLVVAGTGRCGTKFMTEVLNSVNVPCAHQHIFQASNPFTGNKTMVTEEYTDKLVTQLRQSSPVYDADSSWCVTPFLGMPCMQGLQVVHLVRHPKKVIDSLIKVRVLDNEDLYGWYTRFAHHHVPEMREWEAIADWAGTFYLRWNEMTEPHATVRWRVEDSVRGLLEQLDITYEGMELFDDTTYNTRWGRRSDVHLGDFAPQVRDELLEMSGRYGYEWPDL